MCEVDYMHLGLSIPALRGSQGGRDLYVALPSNGVINTFFPTHIESPQPGGRDHLAADRVDSIATYLEDKRDGYVLGAIAYATDSECEFDEASPGSQFGILRLPLNAKLRTIDGQHRREALRTAVEIFAQISAEHTTLMLYVEPSLERRQEMFADMNGAHRPMDESAKGSVVGSDPFESAALRLSSEHPFLSGRVFSSVHRPERGETGYDIGEVIDALKRLFVGPVGRVKSPFRFDPAVVEKRGWAFFDALSKSQRGALITRDASLVVGWPNILKVLAGVAWKLQFDELGARLDAAEWMAALDRIDFTPRGSVWTSSGLSDGTGPMIAPKRPQIIAAVDALVLAMTKQPTAPSRATKRHPVSV